MPKVEKNSMTVKRRRTVLRPIRSAADEKEITEIATKTNNKDLAYFSL